MASRIVSASWSSDGNFLAVGTLSGLVSIRNQKAEEVMKIERKAPIWCLSFIPEAQGPSRAQQNVLGNFQAGAASFDHVDNLAIGCWDKSYFLYR